MFWLKNCPRCSGDIYAEKDTFGPYIACVQCGFQKDIPEQVFEMVNIRKVVPSPSIKQGLAVGAEVGSIR